MDPKTEIMTAWAEYKARNDEAIAQVAKYGQAQGELLESLAKLDSRLDSLEAKGNRPATPAAPQTETTLWSVLRKANPTPEELKTLQVGDGPSGGYLAPVQFVAELIKNVVEFSPVRTVARVISTSNKSVQIPRQSAEFAAGWVSELGTRSESTGLTFALEEIPTNEMYARIDLSNEMLEDAAFNLEAELQMMFAEQFGKTEGAAFISGDAVGKPEGLLTNGSVSYTASGDSDEVTADGLISLRFAVKEPYAANGTWMFNRTTLAKIRKLKEAGSSGQYLLSPGFGDTPATILGRPYALATDMPDEGANTFPVLFGDFRRGYYIVDRVGLTVLRDPYSSAASGAVRILARRRVGGQVVLAEAVRKLKCATS